MPAHTIRRSPDRSAPYAESGTYQICVGASSRNLRLTGWMEWQAAQPLPVHFTTASTLKQVMTHPVGAAIIGPILQRMASAAGGATGKKDDDASSLSMVDLLFLPDETSLFS